MTSLNLITFLYGPPAGLPTSDTLQDQQTNMTKSVTPVVFLRQSKRKSAFACPLCCYVSS